MKLRLILLSIIIFSVSGLNGQGKIVNNSNVLFEIKDDAPVRLQNKINNTTWKLSPERIFHVTSDNASKVVNTLSMTTDDKSQAVLSLSVKNNSNEAVDVTVNFPILNGIYFSK